MISNSGYRLASSKVRGKSHKRLLPRESELNVRNVTGALQNESTFSRRMGQTMKSPSAL